MREKLKDKKFLAIITLGERKKKVGADDVYELLAKVIHATSLLTGIEPEQLFKLNASAYKKWENLDEGKMRDYIKGL